MKKLTIKIETDNAAFYENPDYEISRILEEYTAKIRKGGELSRPLYDINGNRVGEAKAY